MVTLNSYAAGDTDYVSKLNADMTTIASELNSLAAQVVAAFGDGALLISDLWDRDGLVGDQSYQLDLENYDGGQSITIGRRPAAVGALGDQDVSIAWGTYGGSKARVQLSGDLAMSAVAITSGLPKTIYIGIPSSGVPQFYESSGVANVLYAYSMTYNGYGFSDILRMAEILPGYPLMQRLAQQFMPLQVYDGDTDWIDEPESITSLVCPGASDDNLIGVHGSFEVVGGFIHFGRAGDDGLYAPNGAIAAGQLVLEVESEGLRWNLEDLIIPGDAAPYTLFWTINTPVVGVGRYVTEVQEFKLKKSSIGAQVSTASKFTWGLYVRPLMGTPCAKDTTKVVMI